MNDYFNTFHNIEQSVEQLLTGEQNSPEIEQSATSLRESVQPCLEELKQSSVRLKQLVQLGFEGLYHAEDVWNSKPRIAEAAKQEIWEQLGEISGRSFKTRLLRNQLKSQAVEQAKQSWTKRVVNLRERWFTDAQNGKNKEVAAWDKDKFIQDIRTHLDFQSEDISVIVKETIKVFYQELKFIDLGNIKNCVNLLDESNKSVFNAQFNQIVNEVEEKFSNPIDYVASKNLKLTNAAKSALDSLISQGFFIPGLKGSLKQGILSINWQQFTEFSAQVILRIENIITSIVDERVELTTQVLEEMLAFYNYFLERQDRYQQETAEQREAEKAWIDQQRRELERVQQGIEAILNAS
jgi:hypothetical protein